MSLLEVKVPNIGDFRDVPVVEMHVAPGQNVELDDMLITLENDKAAMDIPAPRAGVVKEVHVGLKDKLSEGSPILTLEVTGDTASEGVPSVTNPPKKVARGGEVIVVIPNIGDFRDVPVVEVHVGPGDIVEPEDPLIMLESDKATMDIPAPVAGEVKELKLAVGDKVSEGSLVLTLKTGLSAG